MDIASADEEDDYSEDKPDYIVDEKNRTASLLQKVGKS